MAENDFSDLKIHPEHLEDLSRSGLNDETIINAGLRSIAKSAVAETLGYHPDGVSNMMAFPYPGTDYQRFKIFYDPGFKGKQTKYLQKKGTGDRL